MRKPARKGKYRSANVVAVALPTNPSGPFNNNRIRRIGKEIAVAIESPAIPPTHAAPSKATAAIDNEGKDIAIDRRLNALTISRIPKITATIRTTRNNSL
jgi:hypothetical protein